MGLSKNSTGIKILSLESKRSLIKEDYVIALAGNPNVGKSTVFNALTGLNQHTGNWPGKTVANAEGHYTFKDKTIKVVDLPGTYSLLSNSEEEEIARDYICFNEPDLVVVIADATSLERNLNLFFQISEISKRVVFCVNLIDEAKKKNINIDCNLLSKEIDATVVETAATKNIGIEQLKEVVLQEIQSNKEVKSRIKYDLDIESGIRSIEKVIEKVNNNINEKGLRWISLRFLEGNLSIRNSIKFKYGFTIYDVDNILIEINEIRKREREKPIEDRVIETLINEAERIGKKVVTIEKKYDKFQRKLDKILVSKATGIPIMIMTLLVVLWITITLANYPSSMLANLFGQGEKYLREVFLNTSMPYWVGGILIDGIYVTLAWVISVILPPMAIFFQPHL